MTTTAIVAKLLVIGMMTVIWLVLLVMAAAGIWSTNSEWNHLATTYKDWNVLLGVWGLGGAYTLGILMVRLACLLFGLSDKWTGPPPANCNWQYWNDHRRRSRKHRALIL